MSFSTVKVPPRLRVLSSSIMLLLVWAILCGPTKVYAEKIIAITESGIEFEVADVEADSDIVTIFLKNTPASLEDFVVDIRGLEYLENLKALKFIHVSQILSYDFIAELDHIEVLIISYGRVLNVDFLAKLPKLKILSLEICGDWETGGLPFLDVPLDLSQNESLEYLGFELCGLSRLPSLVNVPKSLRFLDLSYNEMTIDIDDIEANPYLTALETVFVSGITLELEEIPSNFSTSSSHGLLKDYIK